VGAAMPASDVKQTSGRLASIQGDKGKSQYQGDSWMMRQC